MNRFLLPLLLAATGCIDADLGPTSDENLVDDGQEATFPTQPGDSCAANIPLACPSTAWSVTYPSSSLTTATRTTSFTRSNLAGFTSNAGRNQCSATQDIVITGITQPGANLPRGTTAAISADRKSVVFSRAIPGSATIPASGGSYCAFFCDSSAAPPRGCTSPQFPQAGTLTGGGRTRTVQLRGEVDTLTVNSQTGELRMTCKWIVPKSELTTTPNIRPNDVISVDGGANFLRGYDLTGTRLRNACSGLATSAFCAPPVGGGSDAQFQRCVADTTASCVSTFGGPDPCHPEENCGFGSCTRGSDCVSNNCVEGCCVPVIR